MSKFDVPCQSFCPSHWQHNVHDTALCCSLNSRCVMRMTAHKVGDVMVCSCTIFQQWRGMRSFTWLTHCLWDKSGSMAAGWAGRSQSKTCPPSEAAGACHDIECITAPSCCMSRPTDWVRVAPRKTLRHHHSREHLQTQAKHVHELTLSAPETTVCESSAHALVCKMPI